MRVSTIRKDHYWILKCEGTTVGVPPRVFADVEAALEEGANDIILDFSSLSYLSCMGIEALSKTVETALNRGVQIGITAPKPDVLRILKLNGLTREVQVYYNLDDAMARFTLDRYDTEAWQASTDMLLVYQRDLPIAREIRTTTNEHPLNPNFRIKPVREPAEAMEFLLSDKVDCILIDSSCMLFKVSNFIEQVRDHESIPKMPILIVSNDERIEQAESMVRHGGHEILRYPFMPNEVLIRILGLISHHKDQRPFYPPNSVAKPKGWQA